MGPFRIFALTRTLADSEVVPPRRMRCTVRVPCRESVARAAHDAAQGERTVDFVVVGFGLGAAGVLLGVLVTGWLAGRSERAAAAAPSPVAAAHGLAAAAERRGAGQAFLYAGGAVILATVGGLAGGLDDRTGALLIATVVTVGVLGILCWGYLYRARHPMPPRPRRQALRAPDSAPGAGPASAGSAADPFLTSGSVFAATGETIWPDSQDTDVAEMPTNGIHDTLDADADPIVAAPQPDVEIEIEIQTETVAEPESAVPHDSELGQMEESADAAVDVGGNGDGDGDGDVAETPPVVAVVAPGAPASAPWSSPSNNDSDESGEG